MKRFVLHMIMLGAFSNLFCQNDSMFVIFSKNSEIVGFDMKNYNRYQPDHGDYTNIKSLVKNYILINSPNQTLDSTAIDNFEDYNKQIYGLIDALGNKVLFINCFINKPKNKYWKQKTVTVKGGGRCYFSIKINLENNRIYDFWVNAPR